MFRCWCLVLGVLWGESVVLQQAAGYMYNTWTWTFTSNPGQPHAYRRTGVLLWFIFGISARYLPTRALAESLCCSPDVIIIPVTVKVFFERDHFSNATTSVGD